jgi:hypothetical protein
MGRSSNVAFIMKADIVKRFNDYVQKYDNDCQSIKTILEECKQKITSNEGDVLYYWKYVKWNSGNSPFFEIERFINQLDEENLSDKYLFVRLGEEWDDIEYRGHCDSLDDEDSLYYGQPFFLEVVREIKFIGKHPD